MTLLTSRNPYTGEVNATFETYTDEKVIQLLEEAHTAYLAWKTVPVAEKKRLFLEFADLLEQNAELHAHNETKEMGRLYHVAVSGIKGTAKLVRWFANNFAAILAPQPITEEGLTGEIRYDPLGVIYGIAPWNFPYNQLLRAAVPNILAGNTVVYKHASNVPCCAQAIEELFHKAGFPTGVYTNLFISSTQSETILAHPYVRGVNITGGEQAGRTIGGLAGTYIKPSVLELGGNDPFLLLDYTDATKMVAAATTCRIANGGQKCNSSKRFIVLEKYYKDFCQHMATYMSNLKIGDPMDPETEISSLATPQLLKEVDRQVQETISQGAKCLTGGHTYDKERQIYEPTVLVDITPAMTSYKEEVFGPVASIMPAKDIEDAITIANTSSFGLSAVIYGEDIEVCKAVAKRLEGGMIFINRDVTK